MKDLRNWPNAMRRAHPLYGEASIEHGKNGYFEIPSPTCGHDLRIVASSGEGWEHVSVSLPNRFPNWQEMCFVKELFWNDEETVVQYHLPKSKYVNYHPHCLHLWKPTVFDIPIPPAIMIGPTKKIVNQFDVLE